ncbi:hypothetical protein [Streptosporangium sp. NPDC003464]
MIADSGGRRSSRCRWAAPWIAVLICLGLCLGWHSDVLGLPAGTAAEVVAGDAPPADDVPAAPVTRHTQGKREPRTQLRGTATPGTWGAVPPAAGQPARGAMAGGSPATAQAEPDRLILLSISRI